MRLVGLDWTVPDFRRVSCCQETLAVHIPDRGLKGPLHLLIDSTGIKVEGEGEWNTRKHGGPKRRVWRKIHLGTDEKSLEIRAVKTIRSHINNAPVLPDLLSQIPEDKVIGSVTADGTYSTCRMPRCDRRPRRISRHSTPQEREAMEDPNRRRGRSERGPARLQIP